MTREGQHMHVRVALEGVPHEAICISYDSCSIGGYMAPPTCRIGVLRGGAALVSGHGETFDEALQDLKSELVALARRAGRVAC